MSSIWGNKIKISIFGESHGPGIGVVLDGLPSGCAIDMREIERFALRRAPGHTPWSTPRQEQDEAEILSGIYRQKTTGTPLAAVIRNLNIRSSDYDAFQTKPRPGHADLTGSARYLGYQDPRGGGHFSGRLTAPLTFAGAVCTQIVQKKGIKIAAHISQIGRIKDDSFVADGEFIPEYEKLALKDFPVLDDAIKETMTAEVEAAKLARNSIGGIIEAGIWGLPAGLGDPIFGGLESRLSGLILGIPGIKGIEFGDGFAAAEMRGLEYNDPPYISEGKIRFRSNHSGGIQGGISNGMPLIFRIAVRPTASIGIEQQTINLQTMQDDKIEIQGRHDPCIVPRAVPVVEAAAALFVLDTLLEGGFPGESFSCSNDQER